MHMFSLNHPRELSVFCLSLSTENALRFLLLTMTSPFAFCHWPHGLIYLHRRRLRAPSMLYHHPRPQAPFALCQSSTTPPTHPLIFPSLWIKSSYVLPWLWTPWQSYTHKRKVLFTGYLLWAFILYLELSSIVFELTYILHWLLPPFVVVYELLLICYCRRGKYFRLWYIKYREHFFFVIFFFSKNNLNRHINLDPSNSEFHSTWLNQVIFSTCYL